jgi:hypothetical protein
MIRSQRQIPEQFDEIRERARHAISPLKPADDQTKADDKFLFTAERTEAGRRLPPYYLVYFLLVDLLGYRNLGRFEKVAWSVPVDLDGTAFLIEHRKFGLGVFAHNPDVQEQEARRIVQLIQKGVKVAKPYFRWVADEAVHASQLNVVNNSRSLFERYVYFRDSFNSVAAEAEARKTERVVTEEKTSYGAVTTTRYPAFEILRNARWLALAAVDAFFAWTEHIFIHVAILKGKITTGDEVAQLAGAEWSIKFKAALDISDAATKEHFDRLLVIRRQLRNFMAHGAFGKGGEAFSFHSSAGAVPVAFDHTVSKGTFSLTPELAFDNAEAVEMIEKFINHMWSGPEGPAQIYIQEWGLPIILTMARDGTYKRAMSSNDDMSEFAEYLGRQMDDAANMDW